MRIFLACSIILLFQGRPAFASVRDWLFGESWDFMQRVGGIAVGEPTRAPDGQVFLPVRCDVSGLQAITQAPTAGNSALIVRRVSKKVHNHEVEIAVKTSLTDTKSNSRCEGVALGDLPAGAYQIYYRGSDGSKHSLAEVKVPPPLLK